MPHKISLCLSLVPHHGTWDLPLHPACHSSSSHLKASREGCLWSLPALEWTPLMETGGWAWGQGYFSDASSIDL